MILSGVKLPGFNKKLKLLDWQTIIWLISSRLQPERAYNFIGGLVKKDKNLYFEDEMIIVRNSGEIPEVTLHGSLHYLTKDPAGPGLKILAEDRLILASQALKRYEEIILRDLDPENRDKTIYRGLARSVVNWERCQKFCLAEKLDSNPIRIGTAKALATFLHRESEDIKAGIRTCCLNCPVEMVADFVEELGLSPEDLPHEWQKICGSD